MIHPGLDIRKAFGGLLSGILYEGKPVPVVDIFGDDVDGRFQIYLGDIDGTNDDDKHTFTGWYNLTIEVVTKTIGSGNRFIVDKIGDDVTARIQPARDSRITLARFQLLNLQLSGSSYLTESTKTDFIVRKIFRYRFQIVQI